MGRAVSVMLIAMLLLLTNAGLAVAGADLLVGPGTIAASPAIDPGQRVMLPAHEITNNSYRALEMIVSVSDRTGDERILPPGEWFSITPDELIVQARSSAEVQVELMLPDDAPPGEYKVWFLFDSMPIGASGMIAAAAVNVSFTFDVADAGQSSARTATEETQVEEHTLTLTVSGGGATEPAPGTHAYGSGSDVELTAAPDEGWKFHKWLGDVADVTSASTTVRIDADTEVIAVFTQEVPDAVGLTVSPTDLALDVGQSVQLTAVAEYDDGETHEVTPVWTSVDEDVVTVDHAGKITATGAGETQISAEFERHTCPVDVLVLPPSSEDPEPVPPGEEAGKGDGQTASWPMIVGLVALGGFGWALYRRHHTQPKR